MTEQSRTARLQTDHHTPTRATWVANAVRPDNTDSMSTTLDGSTVETHIERDTTGGVQTTVDDYIVNLGVATSVIKAIESDANRTVSDQSTDNTYYE